MTTVPRALLQRSMDFGGDARAQVAGALCGALAAIALAATGYGVRALVVQSVLANLVTLVATMLRAGWWPRPVLSPTAIRPLARFSSGVLGASLLGYTGRHADNLLIGRFLGDAALGYYALAYRLMLMPLTQVSAVITRVLFPALSSVQDAPERFRRGYLLAISGIATITFPMMLGLLAVSHEFILVVFSEKWLPAETVLRVFCLVGLMQSIGTTAGTIFLATGQTRKLFLMSSIATPLFLAAFVIGLPWGIEGVAVAYGIASASMLYVSVGSAIRIVGLTLGAFHRALAGPAAAALTMFLAVLSLQAAIGDRLGSPAVRLTALALAGVTIYLSVSFLINGRQLRDLIGRIRSAMADSRT
jgi:PST family polysaccharide transporter